MRILQKERPPQYPCVEVVRFGIPISYNPILEYTPSLMVLIAIRFRLLPSRAGQPACPRVGQPGPPTPHPAMAGWQAYCLPSFIHV